MADPAAVSKHLFEFLGLEAIPIQRTVHSTINEKYFDVWREDQAKLKKTLLKSFWKTLPRDTERRLNTFGYSLNPPAKLLKAEFIASTQHIKQLDSASRTT